MVLSLVRPFVSSSLEGEHITDLRAVREPYLKSTNARKYVFSAARRVDQEVEHLIRQVLHQDRESRSQGAELSLLNRPFGGNCRERRQVDDRPRNNNGRVRDIGEDFEPAATVRLDAFWENFRKLQQPTGDSTTIAGDKRVLKRLLVGQ